MIVVHIDTTTDAHTLIDCYKDAKDTDLILVNPKREDVVKALKERPNETLMGLGHGSPSGLFGCGYGNAIDGGMVDLLKDREMIGIWCHAKDFGRRYGLKGFFTSMFVSNPNEASWYQFKKVSEEVTQEQNTIFSKKVNGFIKEGLPLDKWIENLQDYDHSLDFVCFNYENLEYFDGTQKPYEVEKKTYLNEDFGYFEPTLFDSADMIEVADYDNVDALDTASGDINDVLEYFRTRMEYDSEIAVGCTTLTREQLDSWQATIDEMKNFCKFA